MVWVFFGFRRCDPEREKRVLGDRQGMDKREHKIGQKCSSPEVTRDSSDFLITADHVFLKKKNLEIIFFSKKRDLR